MKLEKIHVNIWDDYYDDGHVPEGEKQETRIYVEEYDIPEEDKELYIEYIYDKIMEIKKKHTAAFLGAVKFNLGYDIRCENLTHKKREYLLQELQNMKLEYNGIPFNIYSES